MYIVTEKKIFWIIYVFTFHLLAKLASVAPFLALFVDVVKNVRTSPMSQKQVRALAFEFTLELSDNVVVHFFKVTDGQVVRAGVSVT